MSHTKHHIAEEYGNINQIHFTIPIFSKDNLSCTISIQLNNIPLIIATNYRLIKHIITTSNLSNNFYLIISNYNNFIIIGGDYNAKHQSWGCLVINNPRESLLQFY